MYLGYSVRGGDDDSPIYFVCSFSLFLLFFFYLFRYSK